MALLPLLLLALPFLRGTQAAPPNIVFIVAGAFARDAALRRNTRLILPLTNFQNPLTRTRERTRASILTR